jgi:Raffinose synthase or seed imbibition protein Sip1
MFETTNPNALMHAVARVANNGPIYITDEPGKHDIKLIKSRWRSATVGC